MVLACSFMQAYCKLGEVVIDKFLADLEVRFVMHVLKTQVQTCKNFPSLKAIMQQLWSDVKALDKHLPAWQLLQSTFDTAANPLPPPGLLKELHEDGKISKSELHACRFILGALVTDQSGDPYEIVSLDDELNVSLEKIPKANAEDNTEEKDNKGKANAEHKKEKKDNEAHQDDKEKKRCQGCASCRFDA